MKEKELQKRNWLKEHKPLVYEKMIKGNIGPILQCQLDFRCNFKCQHCSISKFQGRKDGRKVEVSDIKELSRQADELGMARFVITGGEPLIFPNLDEIVAAIDPSRFYINLDTNGWYLDKEKILHLKSIGVDRVQLSIDSLYPEEHDDFRRMKGSHERCMKAADLCVELEMPIFIQTVVTKQRLYSEEFTEFIKYFNDKGIDVFVSFAKPVGVWEGNTDILISNDDLVYMRTLESLYNVFTHLTPGYGCEGGCASGRNIISFTQYGDFLACPYFHCSLGNFFEEPLKVILDRINRLKPFKTETCPIAADKDFIEKYEYGRIYGKSLPVRWTEVFDTEDFL